MNLQQHICVGQPKKEEINVGGFLLVVLLATGFSVWMVSAYRWSCSVESGKLAISSVSFLFKRCSVTQIVSNRFLHHHSLLPHLPLESKLWTKASPLGLKKQHNKTSVRVCFLASQKFNSSRQTVGGDAHLPVLGQAKARRDYSIS